MTTCLDIEIAIFRKYDIRRSLIVPNVSNQMGLVAFETDMLVLSEAGYAHGFEIKTSKSDLKADFKKPQHQKFNDFFKNGKTGLERFYGKFKYFSYAVPEQLREPALELIPQFCGLYVFNKKEFPETSTFSEARAPKKLFSYQWTLAQKYELARLGTMRVYSLKFNQLLHRKERSGNLAKMHGDEKQKFGGCGPEI